MGRPVFGNVLSASLKLKCILPALRLWGRSKGVGWILKRMTTRSPVLMVCVECSQLLPLLWVWYSMAALLCCSDSGSLRSSEDFIHSTNPGEHYFFSFCCTLFFSPSSLGLANWIILLCGQMSARASTQNRDSSVKPGREEDSFFQ